MNELDKIKDVKGTTDTEFLNSERAALVTSVSYFIQV